MWVLFPLPLRLPRLKDACRDVPCEQEIRDTFTLTSPEEVVAAVAASAIFFF
jgi:hypothetical protein